MTTEINLYNFSCFRCILDASTKNRCIKFMAAIKGFGFVDKEKQQNTFRFIKVNIDGMVNLNSLFPACACRMLAAVATCAAA